MRDQEMFKKITNEINKRREVTRSQNMCAWVINRKNIMSTRSDNNLHKQMKDPSFTKNDIIKIQ